MRSRARQKKKTKKLIAFHARCIRTVSSDNVLGAPTGRVEEEREDLKGGLQTLQSGCMYVFCSPNQVTSRLNVRRNTFAPVSIICFSSGCAPQTERLNCIRSFSRGALRTFVSFRKVNASFFLLLSQRVMCPAKCAQYECGNQ